MNKKHTEIIIQRIKKFYSWVGVNYLEGFITFKAEFSPSKEHIPFENRLKLKYKTIAEGDHWGKAWDSGWFHLKATVPRKWKQKQLVAHLDFSGEGHVFDNQGRSMQGITNGSIYDPNFKRVWVPLTSSCTGSEKYELWVEAAANTLFGVYRDSDPSGDSPNRHGHFNAKVIDMKLRIFNEDLWHLWLDIRILSGLILRLPEDSVQRSRIIECVNSAIEIFGDNKSNTLRARQILKNELSKSANASALTVSAIGHAHIDTGWLWPVKETIRKCARTFSNQLSLMERYPDYIFGASQPQHYQFMKEHYPKIYDRIKNAVKNNQWELQGGMWVEADCNLISGESMIRQILFGKNYFMDEFGEDIDNLWLPDVFGYSAALPQILNKSGIKYFLTQKLSWSQFNEFPHHTFIWKGIDGSEVLTHFPPESTYNSELDTEFLLPAQDNFKEKNILDEFISLFGVGNGGGGPKPENIEFGHRLKSLESSPRVRFSKAKNFFKRIDKSRPLLKKWVGELYLELHRGTLTSQAKVKKMNRKLESLFRTTEMYFSMLPLNTYPTKELERLWKLLLINQFHDIIPGSSITEVYRVTHAQYKEIFDKLNHLIQDAADSLLIKDKSSITFFNQNHYHFNDVVDIQGIGKVILDIDPYSIRSIKIDELNKVKYIDKNNVLENDLISYTFNKKGQLISSYDKELNKEMLMGSGNVLTLYDDHPNNWDAWDIDIFYENSIIENIEGKKVQDDKMVFKYSIGEGSSVEQHVSLSTNSKRLDFKNHVDWNEKHRMLRVSFSVNVSSDYASFDIQYGYVSRPTHRNTSWDLARFEVVGHKYADLSNEDFGVALLNDSKYGYKVLDNIIDLNLLRSPNDPDPDADQGKHSFCYSFLPHRGRLIESNVISEATHLNHPIHILKGYNHQDATLPIFVKGEGLSLAVIKKAEKEELLIIRVIETHGKHSNGIIHSINSNTEWIETNLMEWENKKSYTGKSLNISLKPFEIRTLKVKLSSI